MGVDVSTTTLWVVGVPLEAFYIADKIRIHLKLSLNHVPLSHEPRTGNCLSMFGLQNRPYIVRKKPPLVEQIRENDDRGILKSVYSKLRTTLGQRLIRVELGYPQLRRKRLEHGRISRRYLNHNLGIYLSPINSGPNHQTY